MKIARRANRNMRKFVLYWGHLRDMCKPRDYEPECISCRARKFITDNGRRPFTYEEVKL